MTRRIHHAGLAIAGLLVGAFFTFWVSVEFPQNYAPMFYTIKASVGMATVILTIIHMDLTWDHLRSGAQQLRYLALLFGTVVAGGGTIEQLHDRARVELINIGGLEFLIVVAVAMCFSLREDSRRVAVSS